MSEGTSPELPPPPLATESVPVRTGPPLWAMPVTTLVAGAVAGLVGVATTAAMGGGSRGFEVLFPIALWYGAVVGLGAALGDRWVRAWPRAARWAAGMGLAGLVLDPAPVFLTAQGRLWSAQLLPTLVVLGVFVGGVFAIFGAVVGWAAGDPSARRWRMPVAGLVFGLVLAGACAVFLLPPQLAVQAHYGAPATPILAPLLTMGAAAGLIGCLMAGALALALSGEEHGG